MTMTATRPDQTQAVPTAADPLYAAVIEGADAANNTGTRYRIAVGDVFTGSLSPGDYDWVAVQLVAGQTYTFELDGIGIQDTYLQLYGPNGGFIVGNDDAGALNHSEITFTATTSGTYYMDASSYSDNETGTYRMSYKLGSTPGGGDVLTMTEIAEYLTEGYWSDNGQSPRAFNVAQGGVLTVDMTDLGAAEQRVARMALQAWTEVTGIRFNTASTAGTNANLRFTNDDTSGAYSTPTSLSGTTTNRAMVNIPIAWAEGPSAGFATYYYQTWLHEIGHAIGLGHAGPYNGSATYGVDNGYDNDSWQATVMSYFSQTDNTTVNASRAYVVTPMIADIIAMQMLYGQSTGLFGGNSVWGEGSNITGAFGMANRLMITGADITMTVFDQGGTDWLKFGGDRTAQVINMTGGSVSNVYGLIGNLSIAEGTVIENVIAGMNNDRVVGNAANNHISGMGGSDALFGMNGNDTLEGGAGADRLVGGLGNDLYIVDARDTLVELAGQGIDRVRADFSFTLGANFEALLLIQSFAKFGTGNALANTLVGNSQVNYLSGGAGNDTIFGMAGNDTLAGNGGADRLVGGDGNDTYIRDALDTVVETSAQGGFDTVMTGRDIVLGQFIERVVVTGEQAVRVTGNAQDNQLFGNNAANVLNGGGGNDVMFGGGGSDLFVFTAGSNARIGDFQNDLDVIRIHGAAMPGQGAEAILSTARESAGGVDLSIGGGTLRIDGITLDALRDDILLVG